MEITSYKQNTPLYMAGTGLKVQVRLQVYSMQGAGKTDISHQYYSWIDKTFCTHALDLVYLEIVICISMLQGQT